MRGSFFWFFLEFPLYGHRRGSGDCHRRGFRRPEEKEKIIPCGLLHLRAAVRKFYESGTRGIESRESLPKKVKHRRVFQKDIPSLDKKASFCYTLL